MWNMGKLLSKLEGGRLLRYVSIFVVDESEIFVCRVVNIVFFLNINCLINKILRFLK